MSYLKALRYLNSLNNYEQKSNYPYSDSFDLERIKGFLRLLGQPQRSLRCLHVAGSKGKGSVCVFAAYILRAAGHKVGLYTSPHLIDFRERIRILRKSQKSKVSRKSGIPPNIKQWAGKSQNDFEGMISRNELVGLVERIKPEIKKYNQISKSDSLTFFEVFTALAFLYFKEKKVDFAVLETGLGGRLDATNTVNSLACAITPISYEHTNLLGKSLAKIAREKAGIVKVHPSLPLRASSSPFASAQGKQLTVHSAQNAIVITAQQEKEALDVIKKRCLKVKAKLYEAGKDIVWRAGKVKDGCQYFMLQGLKREYRNLKIKLFGGHQLANAALAVGMIEALEDARVGPEAIKRGLASARWPGRLEAAGKKPLIILDGAQNAASANALKEAIMEYYTYRKLILVLGVSSDKDVRGICKALEGIADKIILTKAGHPRAKEPGDIGKFITKPSNVTHTVKEAVALSRRLADSKDLILVAGSLFVVGEARRFLIRDGSLKTGRFFLESTNI